MDVERQVVGIVVAVVVEAAVLDQQAAGVGRGRRAGVPTDRPGTGDPGQHAYRLADCLALLVLPHGGGLLPAPAVAGNLVAAPDRVLDQPGRELGGASAGADGGRHAEP